MRKNNCNLTPQETQRLTRRYQRLAARLSRVGWISQGSVMHAPPGAWRWTRKVRAKTVSVALSAAQAQLMKEAISNHRQLDELVDAMREITQKLILGATPGVRRRSQPKPPKTSLS